MRQGDQALDCRHVIRTGTLVLRRNVGYLAEPSLTMQIHIQMRIGASQIEPRQRLPVRRKFDSVGHSLRSVGIRRRKEFVVKRLSWETRNQRRISVGCQIVVLIVEERNVEEETGSE